VPTITLPQNFSIRTVPRLVEHLKGLSALFEESELEDVEEYPDLAVEIDRIGDIAKTWYERAQELFDEEEGKDSPNEEVLERREQRAGDLEAFNDALAEYDLESAIETLEGME